MWWGIMRCMIDKESKKQTRLGKRAPGKTQTSLTEGSNPSLSAINFYGENRSKQPNPARSSNKSSNIPVSSGSLAGR